MFRCNVSPERIFLQCGTVTVRVGGVTASVYLKVRALGTGISAPPPALLYSGLFVV